MKPLLKILLSIVIVAAVIEAKGQVDSVLIQKDSFTVKYVFNWSHYMSTLVGYMICDSNLTHCVEDTAAIRLDRHYIAQIFIYKNNSIIGRPHYGYYKIGGCWDASPECEINIAINDIKVSESKLKGK